MSVSPDRMFDKLKNSKGTVTLLVTYIKHYKYDNKKPILISFDLGKDAAVNAITKNQP